MRGSSKNAKFQNNRNGSAVGFDDNDVNQPLINENDVRFYFPIYNSLLTPYLVEFL
jgi:hypothetical protein